MKDESEDMDAFDHLINKASAMEEYTMREEDWNQLASMLDTDDRRRLAGWIWRGALGLLLLMFIAIGVGVEPFLLNQDVTMGEGMEAINAQIEVETLEKTEVGVGVGVGVEPSGLENENTDESFNAQVTTMNDSKGNAQTSSQEAQQAGFIPAVGEEVVNIKPYVQESKSNSFTYSVISFTKSHEIEVPATSEAAFQMPQERGNEAPQEASLEVDSVSLANGDAGQPIVAEEVDTDEPATTGVSPSDAMDTNPFTADGDSAFTVADESSVFEPVDTAELEPAIEALRRRKLHFYVGAGTDWSRASQMPIGPTKLKLQIGGEYLLLNRLSVLGGVNYAVKAYETNSENYTVKQGFWTNGLQPNSIRAECRIIEVPLSLRYYFKAQGSAQSSFYVMAGVSSYLMASEQYSFTYGVEDPALRQEWKGEWESIDYFSVLTFSAGYQQRVSKNWSVLLEPYVNLPLTGIGFAEVDFISFGLSAQLRY